MYEVEMCIFTVFRILFLRFSRVSRVPTHCTETKSKIYENEATANFILDLQLYFLNPWKNSDTYLSKVAARMYFPLGENLTNDTGGLSSSMRVFKHWPDAVSHIRLKYTFASTVLIVHSDFHFIEIELLTYRQTGVQPSQYTFSNYRYMS